jgi:predicted RNA-binding Zn ribbon-like protein
VADPEFLLLGDPLWLDFLNTAESPAQHRDALPDPAAYLRWTKAVRVEPPMSAAAFGEAIEFRARLRALALALEGGRRPPPSSVTAVNARLGRFDGREQLVRVAGTWQLRFIPARPPTALEAVARSVGETLARPVMAVRRCANPACGLFFADESPQLSRRWCGRGCGQMGKVERRRTARPAPLVGES